MIIHVHAWYNYVEMSRFYNFPHEMCDKVDFHHPNILNINRLFSLIDSKHFSRNARFLAFYLHQLLLHSQNQVWDHSLLHSKTLFSTLTYLKIKYIFSKFPYISTNASIGIIESLHRLLCNGSTCKKMTKNYNIDGNDKIKWQCFGEDWVNKMFAMSKSIKFKVKQYSNLVLN